MAGAPRVKSMNAGDIEARPVLVPAGNKARLVTRKLVSKPSPKVEEEKKQLQIPVPAPVPAVDSPPSSPALSPPALLRRHELLLHSNLSLNASCSSDASTESFCSRASTGRIARMRFTGRRRQTVLSAEKIGANTAKPEKIVPDGVMVSSPEVLPGRRRCAWVTPNTDPCYVAYHDEEWGVPVHDDKKLFELLVFSSALSELTWPAILSKRQSFREVFMDFNPDAVAKLNEKKIIAPGSTASFLLSEPKLRAVIENSRQMLKIVVEFGSFSKYCWSFVNNKPITSTFRYPRQVLVKSPKADVISKDLVRRGFRCVGPTVIYSFMQAAGLTNDHLVSCFRFSECATAVTASVTPAGVNEGEDMVNINQKVVLEKMDVCEDVAMCIDLQL